MTLGWNQKLFVAAVEARPRQVPARSGPAVGGHGGKRWWQRQEAGGG
jgi:hypothetical protein